MISLADVMKQSKEPMQKAFVSDLLRFSNLLATVPFDTVEGVNVAGTRWQTLPGAGFRKYGAGYTESSGTIEEVVETLALLGGDVKIDKVGEKVKSALESALITNMKMKAKSIAFAFNDAFINGDHGVNPDSFEGLKKRISNMPARQSIDLASAGDALKVKASAATMNTFIDAIHQAIKVVDGATHIICNENTHIQFGSVLRNLGLANSIELYDRKWLTFGDVPLIDVGLKADKSSEIIASTEDPGDGGNDATSIYVVRMDGDDGLRGIQLNGMGPDVYDPLNGGESETGPQFIRRIDWAVGLYNLSNYSIARVKGFKMAAS